MYCLCAAGLGVSIIWCFVLDLDPHTVLFLVVHPRRLRFCPTDRFGLPVFLCRTCEDFIAGYIMDMMMMGP